MESWKRHDQKLQTEMVLQTKRYKIKLEPNKTQISHHLPLVPHLRAEAPQ